MHWKEGGTGNVLNRTTGFNGLMQFLPYAYVSLESSDGILSQEQFDEIFEKVNIQGADVNRDNYLPGTSGAARFRDDLKAQTNLL